MYYLFDNEKLELRLIRSTVVMVENVDPTLRWMAIAKTLSNDVLGWTLPGPSLFVLGECLRSDTGTGSRHWWHRMEVTEMLEHVRLAANVSDLRELKAKGD